GVLYWPRFRGRLDPPGEWRDRRATDGRIPCRAEGSPRVGPATGAAEVRRPECPLERRAAGDHPADGRTIRERPGPGEPDARRLRRTGRPERRKHYRAVPERRHG